MIFRMMMKFGAIPLCPMLVSKCREGVMIERMKSDNKRVAFGASRGFDRSSGALLDRKTERLLRTMNELFKMGDRAKYYTFASKLGVYFRPWACFLIRKMMLLGCVSSCKNHTVVF